MGGTPVLGSLIFNGPYPGNTLCGNPRFSCPWFYRQAPPVWGFVTLAFMYSSRGLSPRRLLHDRCAGLSGPVMLPPAATALMWSAVKALRSVYGAV